MKNCLIVFYSRTGFTRKVAEEIEHAYQCDIEQIRDLHPRTGVLGIARSIYEALTGKLPAILPVRRNPADYSLVILGAPVWAGHIASPMGSYIHHNKALFKQVAAFCTMGGSGGDKALAQISKLCRKKLVAELVLTADQIGKNQYLDQIGGFRRNLPHFEANSTANSTANSSVTSPSMKP